MGTGFDLNEERATGRVDYVGKNKQRENRYNNQEKMLHIRHGVKVRHPRRVLHQHEGLQSSTDHVSTAWEKSLMHDQERINIPDEYKVKGADDGMIASQLGLVSTALDNFKQSKNKLSRVLNVGV